MIEEILLNGLPALKMDKSSYLLYAPYKRTFVRIPKEVVDDPGIISQLKESGFFEFPLSFDTTDSVKVVLNVTKRCNLLCSYCWADSGPHANQIMSPETAVEIIRNLAKSNRIERIHFMGGEPTTNFETIKAVVTYLNDSGVDPLPIFYVTTNGVMSSNVRDWLIKNEFAFSISWDGIPVAHDKQRSYMSGRGSEDRVADSILGVAETGLPLRIRMTVSKLNLPYLYESVLWLADHSVEFVHLEAVAGDGRGSEFTQSYAPHPDEFADEFFRVVKLAEERGIWIMNSHLANLYTPRNHYCSALRNQVYNFNPDGSISHCYKVQGHNDRLANHFVLGEHQNNGKLITINQKKSVRLSSTNVSEYPECEDLSLKYLYSGGCPHRNLVATGARKLVDQNAREMSQLLLRRAIFHIYRRAQQGKTTALEGYIHFYRLLIHDRSMPSMQNNVAPDENNLISGCEQNPFQFTPIPIGYKSSSVGINAPDICI